MRSQPGVLAVFLALAGGLLPLSSFTNEPASVFYQGCELRFESGAYRITGGQGVGGDLYCGTLRYGSTDYAQILARARWVQPPLCWGDLTADGLVNFEDVAELKKYWMLSCDEIETMRAKP